MVGLNRPFLKECGLRDEIEDLLKWSGARMSSVSHPRWVQPRTRGR